MVRRAKREESKREVRAVEPVEDLRQMILQLRAEIRDRLPNQTSVLPHTLKELSEIWLPRKLKKIAAPETFEGRVRLHILPALGHHTHETLLQAHVEDMMDAMVEQEYAPQTANHVREAGRQMVAWGLKNAAWLGSNPFADTPKLDVPNEIKETLTREEAVTLLRYGIAPKWRSLFRVALYMGQRRKTIFHLRPNDISTANKLIDFRITKTGKPILNVPIPDRLFPHLQKAMSEARGEWLFSQRNGNQMSGKSHVLNNALEEGIHRANITRQGRLMRLTFHGLRRCSSTLHQQAGCHPWVVSKVLGHSQEGLALFGNLGENMTAQRYTNFEEEYVRRELNKLNLEP